MDVTPSKKERHMSFSVQSEETLSNEILIANRHHGTCDRNRQVRDNH